MKKRVLLYIDSLTCGGAEKSLVSLLPLLDYNKMDVTLMLGKRGGLFERYIPQEVKAISLPEAKGLSSIIGQLLFSVLYRLYGILGISRHGAELLWTVKGWTFPELSQEFDVAIAYQQGFPTYYVAKKVDATRKFAWINVDIEKAGYRMRFNNKFYKIYDGILAVSDALRNLVIEQGYSDKSKTGVIYDIINVDMIRKMADEFIEMSFNGIKIVTVGRLTPPQNHILAVETAKRLKMPVLIFTGGL